MGDGKWLPIGAKLQNLLPAFGEAPLKSKRNSGTKRRMLNQTRKEMVAYKDDDWEPRNADQQTYLPPRPLRFRIDKNGRHNARADDTRTELIAYSQSGLRRRKVTNPFKGNALFSYADLHANPRPNTKLNHNPNLQNELGLDRFVLAPRPKVIYRLRATCVGGGSARPPDTPSTQHRLKGGGNNGDDEGIHLHPFFTNSVMRLEDMGRRMKIDGIVRVTNLCQSHDLDAFVVDYAKNDTEWAFLKAHTAPPTRNRLPDYTMITSFDQLAVTKRFVVDAGGPQSMPVQGLGVDLTMTGKLATGTRDALVQFALAHGADRAVENVTSEPSKNGASEWSGLKTGSWVDNTRKGLVVSNTAGLNPSLPPSLGNTEHELIFVNRITKGRTLLVGWLRDAAQMEQQQRLLRKKEARAKDGQTQTVDRFVPVAILPKDHQVTVKSRWGEKWATRDLESGLQLALNVGAVMLRSHEVFQITWTAHKPVKAVSAQTPSDTHMLQLRKQKNRRSQKLQQQMLAAMNKAKQFRAEHNFLAATYADEEMAALRKEFVQLENSPLTTDGTDPSAPKLPSSAISVMHRSGRDKRTKTMQVRDVAKNLKNNKHVPIPPKVKVIVH